MIEAISILSFLLVICIFVIVNLLRKIEKIDDELTDVSMNMEEFIVQIKSAKNKINEIDSKGIFEKDDEVGTVFAGIKDVIDSINLKYDIEETDNEKQLFYKNVKLKQQRAVVEAANKPRRGRPRKNKLYFTQDTEDAIIAYNTEEIDELRNKVFNDYIYKPL